MWAERFLQINPQARLNSILWSVDYICFATSMKSGLSVTNYWALLDAGMVQRVWRPPWESLTFLEKMFCREKQRVAARALMSPDTSKDSSVTVASSTPPMMGMSDMYTFHIENKQWLSSKLNSICGQRDVREQMIQTIEEDGEDDWGWLRVLALQPLSHPLLFSCSCAIHWIWEQAMPGTCLYAHCTLCSGAIWLTNTSLKGAIKHLQSATRSENQDAKVNTICLCWHTQCADTWFYLLLHNTALSVTTLIGLERGLVLVIICLTGLAHQNKLGCLIFPVLRLTFSVSAAPPPTGSQHAQSHKIRNCFPLSTRKRLNEE